MSQRYLNAIQKTDAQMKVKETEAIAQIEGHLLQKYLLLEKHLLRVYGDYSADALPNLLPNQRSLLLSEELKEHLILLKPSVWSSVQDALGWLLQVAAAAGTTLSAALMQLITGVRSPSAKAIIRAEILTIAAERAYDRVLKHCMSFADKAIALLTQGLIQNQGVKRVATSIRQQLGILKRKLTALVSNEAMVMLNQAAQHNYRASEIEYFMSISVGDSSVCPVCVARNLQVYRIDEASLPWHVLCRCYELPWSPEWEKNGLIDREWLEALYAETLAALAATGRKVDNGLTASEIAIGAATAPVWTLKHGYFIKAVNA